MNINNSGLIFSNITNHFLVMRHCYFTFFFVILYLHWIFNSVKILKIVTYLKKGRRKEEEREARKE